MTRQLPVHQSAKTEWASKRVVLYGRRSMVRRRITCNRSRNTRRATETVGGILGREQRMAVLVGEEAGMVEEVARAKAGRTIATVTVQDPGLSQGQTRAANPKALQRIQDLCILRGKQNGSSRSRHLWRLSRGRRLCLIRNISILYLSHWFGRTSLAF